MSDASNLYRLVRDAWASIPAPPDEDMQSMSQKWSEQAERAFVGVAPVDVDIDSASFDAATPLLDLPPKAAAAYLGTFIMSLLKGLEFQQRVGVFTDVLSRAHTITCLTLPWFWKQVVRPFLSPTCRQSLSQVVKYLALQREALALTPDQVDKMLALDAER